MNQKKILHLCLFWVCSITDSSAQEIIDLRCEFLKDPIGVDRDFPRFTWKYALGGYDFMQNYYQLVVARDSAFTSIVWNSGSLKGSQQFVRYAGKRLESRKQYYWKVETTDNSGGAYESEVSSFTTGIASDSWIGNWIGDGRNVEDRKSTLFRYEFQPVDSVISAQLFIASAGLHEIYFNGERVSNELLNPMFTDYSERILYNSYNTTPYLQDSLITLGVELGNGWYNHQPITDWKFHEADWRDRPKFILNLYLEFAGGSSQIITSNEQWKISDSPYTFNSIYQGENYDGRKKLKDWRLPGYDDSEWGIATIADDPEVELTSQVLEPIRRKDTIHPVNFKKYYDNNYVFEFEKNFSGMVEIELEARKGTIITMRYGEQLGPNNRPYPTGGNHFTKVNGDEEYQVDRWIHAGGTDVFKHKFHFKGFQYLGILASQRIEMNAEDVRVIPIHNDVQQIGKLRTSNEVINQVWEATNNSYLSNLSGYPTDNPNREKNGWTGDGHLALEAGLYNFDGITIYEKWMQDHRDSQEPSGNIPSIIPTHQNWGYDRGFIDWVASTVLIPWRVYEFYGDTTIIAENYEVISQLLDYWYQQSKGGLIVKGYGDWLFHNTPSTPDLLSTARFYQVNDLALRMSEILGLTKRTEILEQRREKINEVFNNVFLDRKEGFYGNGSLTSQAIALNAGVVPADYKSQVQEFLVESLESSGNLMDFGVIGAKEVPIALAGSGNIDRAFEMITSTSEPSWGHWLKSGANSLFESWDYKEGKTFSSSMNHVYFGSISGWFYQYLGGINPDPDQPGFQNILLKPHFPVGLDFVESSFNSVRGLISSNWTRTSENTLTYRITIPANATASLEFPPDYTITNAFPDNIEDYAQYTVSGATLKLVSGEYEFNVTNETNEEALILGQERISEEYGKLIWTLEGLRFLQGQVQSNQGTLVIYDLSGAIVDMSEVELKGYSGLIMTESHLAYSNNLLIADFLVEYEDSTSRQHHIRFRNLGN